MKCSLKNMLIGIACGIAAGLLAVLLGGCGTSRKSLVVSHESADTVMVHDTVNTLLHDSVHVDRVVHDTVVGVRSAELTMTLPDGAGSDTEISKGNLHLHVYDDKAGKQHIDCDADSMSLVIQNLLWENVYRDYRADSIAVCYEKLKTSRTDSTAMVTTIVKDAHSGFFGKLWEGVKNFLAVLGVAFIVLMIIKLIK